MFDFLSKAGSSVMDGLSSVGSSVADGVQSGLAHTFEKLQDPEFMQQAGLMSAALSNDNNRYQSALNAYDSRRQEIARQKREDMQKAQAREEKVSDLHELRNYNEQQDYLSNFTPESVQAFRESGDQSVLQKALAFREEDDKQGNIWEIQIDPTSKQDVPNGLRRIKDHAAPVAPKQGSRNIVSVGYQGEGDARIKVTTYSDGTTMEESILPDNPNGDRKMTVTAEKDMNSGYENANTLEAGAASAEELANKIDANADDWSTGFWGNSKEQFAKFMGNQDEVSTLKTNYQAVRNSEVLKQLPPGPASDKDIAIFMGGFPDESWPADKLSQWLRGQAKSSRLAADYQRFKAEYIGQNNSLTHSNGKSYYQHWTEYSNQKYKGDSKSGSVNWDDM